MISTPDFPRCALQVSADAFVLHTSLVPIMSLYRTRPFPPRFVSTWGIYRPNIRNVSFKSTYISLKNAQTSSL